jgi:F-type H+-transporting ATPase subunit b
MTFVLGLAENSIQLVPDGTILLHVLIILVMVYVLNRTLFKPINQILEAREARTRGRLSEAEEIQRDVTQKLIAYEHSLREARGKAYAFTEHEHAGAMQDRQARLNQMRQEIADLIAREKEAIERQAEEARGQLEKDARRMAGEISTRVLSRPVGGADTN